MVGILSLFAPDVIWGWQNTVSLTIPGWQALPLNDVFWIPIGGGVLGVLGVLSYAVVLFPARRNLRGMLCLLSVTAAALCIWQLTKVSLFVLLALSIAEGLSAIWITTLCLIDLWKYPFKMPEIEVPPAPVRVAPRLTPQEV